MQIKIKRFDKSLPLPAYKTAGAAAFDLCSRIDVTIEPHQTFLIPLNVAIKLPDGLLILMSPRSSMPKLGIIQLNSIGIMDQDYCGDNDEYLLLAQNYTDQVVNIPKGTRLVNCTVLKTSQFEILESENLDGPDRGGFGTTGVK